MVVGPFFQALSLCSDASEVGSGSLAPSFELEALRSHLEWPEGRGDDFSQWGGGARSGFTVGASTSL